MFMGLVDGDGYIEIGPQKQYNKLTKILVKSTVRARLDYIIEMKSYLDI